MMQSTRLASAVVFLCSFLVYIGDARPHPEVDCVAAPYTAWSLSHDGSLDLRMYDAMRPHVGTTVRELADGSWVSMRPPGAAITALPVIAPFAIVRNEPFKPEAMNQLGKLAAALSVAGAAALFISICRRLVPESAWPATILFALGSSLCSVASQSLWMHGPAAFWLCFALYLLVAKTERCRFGWAALAGIAFGMAVLCRPNVAVYGAFTGASYVWCRQWRTAGGLLVGVAPLLVILLLVNRLQFGNAILGGYGGVENTHAPPLWLGLTGLLISPSRGLLIYSPALILIPIGMGEAARRTDAPRPLLIAWGLGCAATVLMYARWKEWHGGWCYGPRFFGDSMPILALLFAYAYAALRSQLSISAARSLVAVSVAIHLLGVYTYGGEYAAWHGRNIRPDDGRSLFSVHDTQIEAHLRCAWRHLTASALPVPAAPPRETT